MKVVVFGNHDLGARCLRLLHQRGHDVGMVYFHAPEKGENVWYESVEEVARALSLPARRIGKLDQAAAARLVGEIRALAPDVLFSLSWRKMLPDEILAIPRLAAVNVHGSLLPRYRGRTPVTWVVANGERETGVTFHQMVAEADAGDILAQARLEVGPFETSGELFRRVTETGVELFARLLEDMEGGRLRRVPQDHAKATHVGRRGARDDVIDWSLAASRVHDLVRAAAPPYPGAVGVVRGVEVRLVRALPLDVRCGGEPGEVRHRLPEGPVVACGDGRGLLALEFHAPRAEAGFELREGDRFLSYGEALAALGLIKP